MTEREERNKLILVSPTIAYKDVFLVFLVDNLLVSAPCARISSESVCAILVETLHP